MTLSSTWLRVSHGTFPHMLDHVTVDDLRLEPPRTQQWCWGGYVSWFTCIHVTLIVSEWLKNPSRTQQTVMLSWDKGIWHMVATWQSVRTDLSTKLSHMICKSVSMLTRCQRFVLWVRDREDNSCLEANFEPFCVSYLISTCMFN